MVEKDILSNIGDMFITTNELEKLGYSRVQIKKLVEANELLRVGRGVYQLSSVDLNGESQYRTATMRLKGKSAVCLLSALAHYNLIDEIPKKTWLMVDADKRSNHKDIRLFRTRNPNWKIGIKKEKGYSITSLESTIIDAIVYKRLLGNLGVEALKKTSKEKLTTLNKIMEIATKLEADHYVLPYLQVLA